MALNTRKLAIFILTQTVGSCLLINAQTRSSADLTSKQRAGFLGAIEDQQHQRFDEAVRAYRALLLLHPDYLPARFNLGLALDESRRYEEALHEFDRVAATDAKYPGVALFRGIELCRIGRLYEAQSRLEEATELNPEDDRSWFWLGRVKLSRSDVKGARMAAEEALQIRPTDVFTTYLLAKIEMADKAWLRAEVELRTVLAMVPNNPEAHEALGSVFYMQSRPQEAIQELMRAVELDSSNAKAQSSLGIVLCENGAYRQAIPHLLVGISRAPDIAELQLDLALAFWRSGEAEKAMPHAQKSELLDEQNPRIHFLMWKIAEETRRKLLAEKELSIYKSLERK